MPRILLWDLPSKMLTGRNKQSFLTWTEGVPESGSEDVSNIVVLTGGRAAKHQRQKEKKKKKELERK